MLKAGFLAAARRFHGHNPKAPKVLKVVISDTLSLSVIKFRGGTDD